MWRDTAAQAANKGNTREKDVQIAEVAPMGSRNSK